MDDITTYRCNACGFNYNEAQYCANCQVPQCPACGRGGCITNLVEMRRLVSDKVPTSKPGKKPSSNGKKKGKKPAKSMETLLRQVAEMEANK